MLTAHRFCPGGSLFVLLVLACNGSELVEPVDEPTSLAASASTVKPPSNMTVIASSESGIAVSWVDNSSNETGFEVHRSTSGSGGPFGLLASTRTDAVGYSDAGLNPSTQYCYQVRAFRRVGSKTSYSSFSPPGCATTSASLAPSAVEAKPIGFGTIGISWVDNSTTEAGFRVERSVDGGSNWIALGTVDPNITHFADFGFSSEERVCYRISAETPQGTWVSSMDCTTPPARPTNLTATAVNAETIELSWTDNTAIEDGYEVHRAASSSGPYSLLADLPPNAISYRDTGLIGEQTYSYRICAKKDGGCSDFSNDASVVLATAPPSPASVTIAEPSSSSVVNVTWIDNSATEEGFRIERSTDGGASWFSIATTPANQTALGDGQHLQEQLLCYRVIAFNHAGDSSPSNTGCTTPPAGPTDLIATEVDPTTFELTWVDNSAVEDGYEVHRVFPLGNGETAVIAELPANSTRYQVSEFCAAPYMIVAKKDGGFSDFSDPVTIGNPAGCW